MKKYKVKEIFGPTIQGEGSTLGHPVLFLRFSGCNKWSGREEDKHKSICSFCDTDFLGGDLLTAQEIAEKLDSLSDTVKTVVISGGEPTLQIDDFLLNHLYHKFNLHLETNGSRPLEHLAQFFTHVSMSPKQGREETKLEQCDDIKLLYPWIRKDINYDEFSEFPHSQAFIQPVWESNKKEALKLIFDHPELKLSPQLHKYLELQ